jgi:four helix bundle protein
MTPDELKARTKLFAVETITFTTTLATDPVTAHVVKQLVRSGTSVGANYRSSCRAKSQADFVRRWPTVEEEADEIGYWLEILVEIGAAPEKGIAKLSDEAEQIVRIAVASIKTARGRSR